MRILILCIIYFLFNSTTFSQGLDYKTVSDSLSTLSCGKVDSLTVTETRTRLENFDTTKITKNIHLYYRDLEWCYYRLYLVTKDTSYIYKCIDSNKKSLHSKSDFSPALWEISFCYYLLGDCKKGKYYLEKYKNSTDKNNWREEQIKRMTAKCKD